MVEEPKSRPFYKNIWLQLGALLTFVVSGSYLSTPKPDGKTMANRRGDFTGRFTPETTQSSDHKFRPTATHKAFTEKLLNELRRKLPALSLMIADNLKVERLDPEAPDYKQKVQGYSTNMLNRFMDEARKKNPELTDEQIKKTLEDEGCVVNLANKTILTPPELNSSGFWYDLKLNGASIGGLLFQDRSATTSLSPLLDIEQKLGLEPGAPKAVQLYMVAVDKTNFSIAGNYSLLNSSNSDFGRMDKQAAITLGVNTYLALKFVEIVNDLGDQYDEVITVIPSGDLVKMRDFGLDLSAADVPHQYGTSYYGLDSYAIIRINGRNVEQVVANATNAIQNLQTTAEIYKNSGHTK